MPDLFLVTQRKKKLGVAMRHSSNRSEDPLHANNAKKDHEKWWSSRAACSREDDNDCCCTSIAPVLHTVALHYKPQLRT